MPHGRINVLPFSCQIHCLLLIINENCQVHCASDSLATAFSFFHPVLNFLVNYLKKSGRTPPPPRVRVSVRQHVIGCNLMRAVVAAKSAMAAGRTVSHFYSPLPRNKSRQTISISPKTKQGSVLGVLSRDRTNQRGQASRFQPTKIAAPTTRYFPSFPSHFSQTPPGCIVYPCIHRSPQSTLHSTTEKL